MPSMPNPAGTGCWASAIGSAWAVGIGWVGATGALGGSGAPIGGAGAADGNGCALIAFTAGRLVRATSPDTPREGSS